MLIEKHNRENKPDTGNINFYVNINDSLDNDISFREELLTSKEIRIQLEEYCKIFQITRFGKLN